MEGLSILEAFLGTGPLAQSLQLCLERPSGGEARAGLVRPARDRPGGQLQGAVCFPKFDSQWPLFI